MPDIHYMFTSKNSIIYDDIGVELFCLFNLSNNINNKQPIKMNGKYFPVKYGMQYGHLLTDFIGPFLYLKTKFPDLKLVFFNFNDKKNNKVCNDLINYFDAITVNIKEDNYIFDELLFFYIDEIRGSLPDWWPNKENSNLFMPPIPSKLFLKKHYSLGKYSKEHLLYLEQSIKFLCKEFFPHRKDSTKEKIYVDRSNFNNEKASEEYKKRRYISNQYLESIKNIAINKNYTPILTEHLGFFEQINLFYNASDVLVTDGTGVLNSIWSKNNVNINKILINKDYKKLNYPWDNILNYGGKYNINNIDIVELNFEDSIQTIIQSLK